MAGNHVGFISNLFAALLFSLPSIYLYASRDFLPLFIYNIALSYVFCAAIARVKWQHELNLEGWNRFLNLFRIHKILKQADK